VCVYLPCARSLLHKPYAGHAVLLCWMASMSRMLGLLVHWQPVASGFRLHLSRGNDPLIDKLRVCKRSCKMNAGDAGDCPSHSVLVRQQSKAQRAGCMGSSGHSNSARRYDRTWILELGNQSTTSYRRACAQIQTETFKQLLITSILIMPHLFLAHEGPNPLCAVVVIATTYDRTIPLKV
jgi:hypothetical protein